jgi:hypothetical protein
VTSSALGRDRWFPACVRLAEETSLLWRPAAVKHVCVIAMGASSCRFHCSPWALAWSWPALDKSMWLPCVASSNSMCKSSNCMIISTICLPFFCETQQDTHVGLKFFLHYKHARKLFAALFPLVNLLEHWGILVKNNIARCTLLTMSAVGDNQPATVPVPEKWWLHYWYHTQ